MKELLLIVSVVLLAAIVHGRNGTETSTPRTEAFRIRSETFRVQFKPNPDSRWVDYEYHGLVGYKLHVKPKNWTEAHHTCLEEEAHLAVIYTQDEYKILQHLFAKAPAIKTDYRNIYAFVGIHDMFEEGKWLTIFDEPIEDAYDEWDKVEDVYQPDNGEEDGQDGPQNCGALVKKGKLADVWCERKFPFFCKHEVKRTPDRSK